MSPPPRVLYVNHVSELGGAERSLLVLLAALDRRRVTPLLAAPAGPLADQAERHGVEVHRIRFGRVRRRGSGRTTLQAIARVLDAARQLRPLLREADLIHANSTAAALAVTLARFPSHRPFVWHVRDLVFPPGVVRFAGGRAAAVIAISRAVKQKLVREGLPPARVVVLANALASGWYDPDTRWDEMRSAIGLPALGPETMPLLAVVAQLVPWKGHDVLLEAFARVALGHPGARLLIIGSDMFDEHPEWVAALRERSRRPDLAGRVLWLGQRQDVPDLLAASDILVLPSHGEPFGRVLLEAMAACRPVIATASGGTPDIIQHGVTGLLVPDWDVDALAGAMDRLLRTPLERRAWMGAEGRALLARGFRPSSHAAAVCDLYRQLQVG